MQPLRKIFKILGKERDYYHACKFCEKFDITKKILKRTDVTAKSCVKRLKIYCKKHRNALDELKIKITENLTKVNASGLKKYLVICNKEIKGILSPALVETKLHFARKKIKNVLLLIKLINSTYSVKQKEQGILQDLIGDWHDLNKFYCMLKNKSCNKISHKKLLVIKADKQQLLKRIDNYAQRHAR